MTPEWTVIPLLLGETSAWFATVLRLLHWRRCSGANL